MEVGELQTEPLEVDEELAATLAAARAAAERAIRARPEPR